jgi:sugar lactone lactonase YvrE
VAAALAAACGCTPDVEPITECLAAGSARPVCGLTRPEDVDLVPGGRFVVISQMGKFAGGSVSAGTLAVLDLSTDATAVVYPLAGAAGAPGADAAEAGNDDAPAAPWGDPACTKPPEVFSPHGLHLSVRADGRLQLWVVNHGSREAVEAFEVLPGVAAQDGVEGAPTVAWRGCVEASGHVLNDVAALPDGGFVASHMYPPGHDTWYGLIGMLGFRTGHAVEWRPASGLRKLPGTEARMPNGIAASADGEQIFLNAYLGNETLKIERATGTLLGRAQIRHPDNASWSPDGMLLVASHEASVPAVMACNDVEKGACGARYAIVALDPATMRTTKVYENEGPPMGMGTSVVRAGDELVIGSFAGDRVVRITVPPV